MEKRHPNELLNEMVAFYAIFYLRRVGFQRTNSRINIATWKFLKNAGINPNTDLMDLPGYNLGKEAAKLQKEQVDLGGKNTSLRSVIRENQWLMPLVAHGPQAWLIETYYDMLSSLCELDRGTVEYGYGKEVYRDITQNVKAARMMFETATQKIADRFHYYYQKVPEMITLVEGGAGNGAATLALLEKFPEGYKPAYILTDIDEKTETPAKDLFKSKGYTEKLSWMKVDLGSEDDLEKVHEQIETPLTVFMVNFIIHEHESIIENFFLAMSKSMPHARLVITEFFLPEDESSVGTNFPWWFVYLHEVSGQKLRTQNEFLSIAEKYGYRVVDQIDHQLIERNPLIATLFLTK